MLEFPPEKRDKQITDKTAEKSYRNRLKKSLFKVSRSQTVKNSTMRIMLCLTLTRKYNVPPILYWESNMGITIRPIFISEIVDCNYIHPARQEESTRRDIQLGGSGLQFSNDGYVY
jgi:hypothetical protein